MRRDETTDVDDLHRPDGNGLQENYQLHDTGEQRFIEVANRLGLTVESWGIDMRDDEGDGIVYDDKLDFKVFDSNGHLVALVDVKTKSKPRYMGRFNQRHYDEYVARHAEFDVPTFVYMMQLDGTDVVDEFVSQVPCSPHRSSESAAVSNFPDGNNAVLLPHEHRYSIDHFISQTMMERTDL